jgi:hypothetical protein
MVRRGATLANNIQPVILDQQPLFHDIITEQFSLSAQKEKTA